MVGPAMTTVLLTTLHTHANTWPEQPLFSLSLTTKPLIPSPFLELLPSLQTLACFFWFGRPLCQSNPPYQPNPDWQVCNWPFRVKYDCTYHEKHHIDGGLEMERPYACDACDKKFMRPSHLIRHRHIHEKATLKTALENEPGTAAVPIGPAPKGADETVVGKAEVDNDDTAAKTEQADKVVKVDMADKSNVADKATVTKVGKDTGAKNRPAASKADKATAAKSAKEPIASVSITIESTSKGWTSKQSIVIEPASKLSTAIAPAEIQPTATGPATKQPTTVELVTQEAARKDSSAKEPSPLGLSSSCSGGDAFPAAAAANTIAPASNAEAAAAQTPTSATVVMAVASECTAVSPRASRGSARQAKISAARPVEPRASRSVRCDRCMITFSSKRSLDAHVKTH